MKKIIKGFLTILFLCLTVSSVSVKAANDDKGTWTRLADTTSSYGSGTSIVVINNKLYSTNRVNNVIEEYDSVADKWIPKANINSGDLFSPLQAVNNKIYVLCRGTNGTVIEEFNPQTNKCIIKYSLTSTDVNKLKPIVVNNKIYVLNLDLNSIDEYDPQTNKYTAKAKLNTTFPNNFNMAVVNDKIYILGRVKSNKVFEYDPQTNKWTDKANMSKTICADELTVVNNKIYTIGGLEAINNEEWSISNQLQEYNPETNKWDSKASMSLGRSNHQVVVLNNKIYAIGGYYYRGEKTNDAKFSNTVEEYDPETNEWTPKANMNITRERHKAVVADNKIYVFGAGRDLSNTAEVFTQETESKNSLNISLDKTSITLLEGETDTLTATITPKDATNKKIIWTSSDESIATVDANGNITAVKKGQVKITAKIDGTDVSASCDVNITTEGDGSSKPEINSNSGILSITLVNGITKDYDLSANEITKFTKWYDASNGKGQVRYGFNKKINPYKTVKEYIVFDKIASFEIREYNAEK